MESSTNHGQDAQEFLNVFSVYKKPFPWSPDYSKDINFLKELRDKDSERFKKFKTFFDTHYSDSLWDTADPSGKAKDLSKIIDDFRWSEEYHSYLAQQKKDLSPANYSNLTTHLEGLEGKSFKAKMEAAEAYVISDLGNGWDKTKTESKIGRLGNAYHATLGRHVFAPFNRRVLQPIGSRLQAFGETAIPTAKLVGLVSVSGIAGLGALVLLGAALPVIATGGLGAAGLQLLGVLAAGVVSGVAGSKVPEASKQLHQAEKVADSKKTSRDETFAKTNDLYRDGTLLEADLKQSQSLIKIKGIEEKDFSGRALLDVKKGKVLLPEAMHLKYAGCFDMGFDRKTGQLLISLQNIDGQTPEAIHEMVQEIVKTCTGKDITQSVILGTECNTSEEMKSAIDNKKQTLLDNRLKDLTNEMYGKRDAILTEALLNPSPQDTESGGLAQYAAIAAQVLQVSSGNDAVLYENFTDAAETKLQEALRQLTGDDNITLAGANPVTKATTAIMGNVIEEYNTLTDSQKKLALAAVVLGAIPEGQKDFAQTIRTAAAIELSRLGVTKNNIETIKTISAQEVSADKPDTRSNNILKVLQVEKSHPSFSTGAVKYAQDILSSTFPPSAVDDRAWTVIAKQNQTVNA